MSILTKMTYNHIIFGKIMVIKIPDFVFDFEQNSPPGILTMARTVRRINLKTIYLTNSSYCSHFDQKGKEGSQ